MDDDRLSYLPLNRKPPNQSIENLDNLPKYQNFSNEVYLN